jgi:MoxR-like ATPase
MAKVLSENTPAKIMIIGASGYGKTSLPKAFAAQNDMKYVRFNVALVRDPEEFFGWRTVENGDVKFVKSEFTKAITGGNAVVVLDELNRATPEMANALFPILDDDARTVVFGEEIVVGKNVIIVATINVGYQFVGTFSIDQALVNRMDITLRVSALPKNIERNVLVRRTNVMTEQADIIVEICNKLRDLTNDGKIVVDASTRTSIRVAKFVANGASMQDAFAWAIVNGADIEERKEIIDTISAKI